MPNQTRPNNVRIYHGTEKFGHKVEAICSSRSCKTFYLRFNLKFYFENNYTCISPTHTHIVKNSIMTPRLREELPSEFPSFFGRPKLNIFFLENNLLKLYSTVTKTIVTVYENVSDTVKSCCR